MTYRITYSGGVIASVSNLASALDVPQPELEALARDQPYIQREIPKPGGGTRQLSVPADPLKGVQRRLVTRILRDISFPHYLFGGIRDRHYPRDYIKCAERHCGAGILSQTDIDSYFDNITPAQIRRIFSKLLKFPNDVTEILVALTTHHHFVPQGAPTSSALANLVLFEREPRIAELCETFGITYTRFIDDIAISHKNKDYDIEPYRQKIINMLKNENFDINPSKSYKPKKNSRKIEVMNIQVNFNNPRISTDERDRIRAAVKDLEIRASEPNTRKTKQYHELWNRTSGRVNKLQRLNYSSYKRLRNRLRKVMPLVGDKEPRRLRFIVRYLEKNIGYIDNNTAFRVKFNRTQNRIGILSRSHPRLAEELKNRMREIRPYVAKD